jgi:hypothetical protein
MVVLYLPLWNQAGSKYLETIQGTILAHRQYPVFRRLSQNLSDFQLF